jgi:aminoglycoside phosphotransferase (APT) family kinase protein
MSFLKRYDAEYYLGWAHRTALLAGPLHARLPWLATLCQRFEILVPLLLAPPPTIIHGEYYGRNILVQDGIVYPVDWESAAIAAGEIDLASLTDQWPSSITEECELAYQHARWPQGTPIEFERRLAAARLYLHFRWLGELRDGNTAGSGRFERRFDEMRSLGEELHLIP